MHGAILIYPVCTFNSIQIAELPLCKWTVNGLTFGHSRRTCCAKKKTLGKRPIGFCKFFPTEILQALKANNLPN
jgi:hypothetical protein